MNAETLIAEIKKLSPSEMAKVAEFVRELSAAHCVSTLREAPAPYVSGLRFMNPAKASSISEGVFARNDELFRKLAQ